MLCVETQGYCKQVVVLSLVKLRLRERQFGTQSTGYEKACGIMYYHLSIGLIYFLEELVIFLVGSN